MGAALLCAACGGGARPSGADTVSIPAASFPAHQRLATPVALRVAVRNDGRRTLADVAVSVDSFATVDRDAFTPVWLVDRGPGLDAGAGAGADQTWALGRLGPGATARFAWRLTPVRAGTYRLAYRVTTGAGAGAAARLADGRPPGGAFTVTVSGVPADPRVDPASGRVARARPRVSGAAAAG